MIATAKAEHLLLSEALVKLGDLPLARIRTDPAPGTATEEDALRLADADDKHLCELIDGILVEKTVGWKESFLAVLVATHLNTFILPRKLGMVFGADGLIRIFPEQIRIPDVAFISRDRFPAGDPEQGIWAYGFDLAIEVISPGNSKVEMARKLIDYFSAGAKSVWYIYPKTKTVLVYRDAATFVTLQETDTLDAGADYANAVLPGFTLNLQEYFATKV
jgi:Uma2 family endonuclease